MIKKLKVKLPKSWKEVTFGQFIALAKCKSETEQLAVFLDIPYEELKDKHIVGLPKFISELNQLNSLPMSTDVPKKILGYRVAKNIEYETVGRFEDMKSIAASIKSDTPDDLIKYTELIAVYAMPRWSDHNPEEQKQFAQQFLNAPCEEVMATGNFILMRLIALIKTPQRSYLVPATLWNKLKRAILNWRARMASSIRLFIWKRRQATKGVS